MKWLEKHIDLNSDKVKTLILHRFQLLEKVPYKSIDACFSAIKNQTALIFLMSTHRLGKQRLTPHNEAIRIILKFVGVPTLRHPGQTTTISPPDKRR